MMTWLAVPDKLPPFRSHIVSPNVKKCLTGARVLRKYYSSTMFTRCKGREIAP